MHDRCVCVTYMVSFLSLCRLLQRYQNVKAELQQQQNLERIRYEKFTQRAGGGATSNSNTAKGKA